VHKIVCRTGRLRVEDSHWWHLVRIKQQQQKIQEIWANAHETREIL